MPTPIRLALTCLLCLAACAPPERQDEGPLPQPAPQPVAPTGAVAGQVRVFVSSAGAQSVSPTDARRQAMLRAINADAQDAAPREPVAAPRAVRGAVAELVLKQGGASAPARGPFVPGDFVIGTHAPLEADALLSRLAPLLGELLCSPGGFAGETLQLLRCTDAKGAPLTEADTLAWVDRLHNAPDVAFVETNGLARAHRAPNDTHYAKQWHYRAMGLESAWDVTTGTAGIVVAVLDTGSGANADLRPNEVPGIDLISDADRALDGDGRDDDPTDVGGPLDSRNGGSGWHGTHVAGTIAAASNNSRGVAGVAWGARVLPIRVLGKGGGTNFDICAGVTWASGGVVPGVRRNTTVARVINMSLGGDGAPSQAYQTVIDAATARGTVVVVAAGNEDSDTTNHNPCNQTNVICVAATDLRGHATQYTNYGKEVTVSAPGGALDRDDDGDGTPDGVWSTIGGDRYAMMQGTSMATPHVAGLVALMLGLKPQLTFAQVRTALVEASTRVANCGTSACGAGLVNAATALAKVQATATTTPARLSLNVSSVVLTAETAARTVLLTNVGGAPTVAELFGSGEHLQKINYQAPATPLSLAPGQTVAVEISWTSTFTRDIEVPLFFAAGASRVDFTARIRAARPAPRTKVVLLRRTSSGDWASGGAVLATADGRYRVTAEPGEYYVAAVSDDDGDGTFEDHEGFGLWPSVNEAKVVRVEVNATLEGVDFSVAPESAGPTTLIGSACTTNAQCGAEAQCGADWPGGSCTRRCETSACGDGAACVAFSDSSWCVMACATPDGTQGTCRPGYFCKRGSGAAGVCLP